MKTQIPRGIDDPPLMLLWPLDEFLFIVILIGVGIMLKKLMICLVVIFISMKIYRRFRDGNPNGYFFHWLYKTGLMLPKSNLVKNPYEDEYLP